MVSNEAVAETALLLTGSVALIAVVERAVGSSEEPGTN